jgi:glycosyltransferase involved in cell wall biosynthesis
VWTAPLTLTPEPYRRAPLDGPLRVGMIGTAAWPPTAAALRALVEEVWPGVRRRVPEARLLVAGRGTAAMGLRGPGMEVRGEVPSSTAFLSELSVLAYPVPRGSGVKVKVLEALATGLPVVTTPPGAEGLVAPGGLVVTPVGDVRAAVDAVSRVLEDPAARLAAGRAARRGFDERYTPERATETLPALYRRMVDGAR